MCGENFGNVIFIKKISAVITVLRFRDGPQPPGASTPYKRWSKCMVHHGKSRGERFCRNLGGSALIINARPLKFLQKCYD